MVPNFDTVILRSQRSEFDKQVKRFEIRLADFENAVQEQLEAQISTSIENLVQYLSLRPGVESLPRYRKASLTEKVQNDELKEMLTEDLEKAFGNVDKLFSPTITIRFKDVTYESIHDGKFRNALEQVMPTRTVEKLFGEYDAAPQIK